MQFKVVSVDVFTDVFFFFLEASAKVARTVSLQLPNRCPLLCDFQQNQCFSLMYILYLEYFHMKRELLRKTAGLEILEPVDSKNE